MKYFAIVAILLLSTFSVLSQDEAQEIAWIRGGNLSEDVASIDIFVNGEIVFSEVTFTEITEYVSVAIGQTEVSLQLHSDYDTELTQFDPITVPLTANETYFFGVGGLAEHDTLEFIAIPETITIKNVAKQNPAFENFSFDTYGGWIFLHGVSQGSNLSVVMQTGETIIPSIGFPGLYASPVSEGRFPILMVDSNNLDRIIFNDMNPFSFNPGVIYLSAVVGSPETPQMIIKQAGIKTLAELLDTGQIVSQMNTLFKSSYFAEAFANDSSYTIFAPTDEALENAGVDIDALINDSEALNQYLETYVIEGTYTFNELRELTEIKTIDGDTITISPAQDNSDLILNESTALNFLGAQGLNGIIYLIDGVIEE